MPQPEDLDAQIAAAFGDLTTRGNKANRGVIGNRGNVKARGTKGNEGLQGPLYWRSGNVYSRGQRTLGVIGKRSYTEEEANQLADVANTSISTRFPHLVANARNHLSTLIRHTDSIRASSNNHPFAEIAHIHATSALEKHNAGDLMGSRVDLEQAKGMLQQLSESTEASPDTVTGIKSAHDAINSYHSTVNPARPVQQTEGWGVHLPNEIRAQIDPKFAAKVKTRQPTKKKAK